MASGRVRLSNAPDIELTLRESPRARRLSLRVSSAEGKVTLTMPRGLPRRQALAFAEERADWIEGAIGRMPRAVAVAPGVTLPVAGRDFPVLAGTGRGVRLAEDGLHVPGLRHGASAEAWLKTRARDALARASDRYAAQVGRTYNTIALRDTRSRWGSCSTAGRLMYSWRLAMAPPEVLDYVAAHEVSHLVHMDHSRAFWSVVERLCPDWRTHRDWLRVHGAGLHRYRFRD